MINEIEYLEEWLKSRIREDYAWFDRKINPPPVPSSRNQSEQLKELARLNKARGEATNGRVLAHVTDEWQRTVDISEKAGIPAHTTRNSLMRMWRKRRVDKEIYRQGPNGNTRYAVWRLPQ